MSHLLVVLSIPLSNQRSSEQLAFVGSRDLGYANLVSPPFGGGVTNVLDTSDFDVAPPAATAIERSLKFSMDAEFLDENPTDAEKIAKLDHMFDAALQLMAYGITCSSVTTVVA